MKSTFGAAVFGAIALQTPLVFGTNSCGAAGDFTDKFEGLKAVGVLTPELPAPVPAPYNGLKYEGVNVDKLTITTLQPQSPPQVVGLFITNDVLNGNLALNPFFTVSAQPGVKGGAVTFDLIEFYFGCIIPEAETATNIASACDISVTGIKANGEIAGELPFSFAPTTLTGSNKMSRANVVAQALTGDYAGLKSVNISITDFAVNAAAGVLYVDNVRHVNRC